MMGLLLVLMIGSIDVAPAFGRDHHKNKGRHDNRRYEHRGHGYRPYDKKRVYFHPRVIYVPPRPRGIDFFFPRIIIHN